MAIPRKKRIYTLTQVSIAVMMALFIGLIFNAPSIMTWAQRLSEGDIKDFFVFIVKPFYTLTKSAHLNEPYEYLRKGFKSTVGIEEDIGFASADDPEGTGTGGEDSLSGEITYSVPDEYYFLHIPTIRSLKSSTPEPSPLTLPTAVTGTGSTPSPAQATAVAGLNPVNPLDLLPFKDTTVYSVKNPLKVLLVGDSFIEEGISMSFNRLIKGNAKITTIKFARYSSGLSRPDFYNWPAKANEIFSKGKYDVVIAMLGMNDAQDFKDGGKLYIYGSPKWFDIYKERSVEFFSILAKNSKKVFWIGAPPMKAAVYNAKMRKLADIHKAASDVIKRVDFVSTVPLYSDAKGKYQDYMKINGKLVQVRGKDGCHWTIAGAELVSREILSRINRDFVFEEIKEEEMPVENSDADSSDKQHADLPSKPTASPL